MKAKVLGKGLDALIPKKTVSQATAVLDRPTESKEFTYLPIDKIFEGEYQPRQEIDDKEIKELSQSIKEKGIIQPIVVRRKGDGYEIVAGARRYMAAKSLGLKELPTIVKDLSDQETFMIAIIENLQRKDLNPVEEAEAFKRLMDEFGYTLEQVAKFLGKDKSSVANTIRLLKLPSYIREALKKGEVTQTQARTILSVSTEKEQRALFEEIISKGLSVREIEKRAKKISAKKKTKDPFVFDMEEKLQKSLGTKVTITHMRNNRGRVVIDYYSLKDLERITKELLK